MKKKGVSLLIKNSQRIFLIDTMRKELCILPFTVETLQSYTYKNQDRQRSLWLIENALKSIPKVVKLRKTEIENDSVFNFD